MHEEQDEKKETQKKKKMNKKFILVFGSGMIGSELHRLVNTGMVEVIEATKLEEKDPFDEFNRLTKELEYNSKDHNNKHRFDKYINPGKKRNKHK